MKRRFRFLALIAIPLLLIACHRGGTNINVGGDIYTAQPVVSSPYKVRVLDVSNDTKEVFDVDVIGLMWNGLDDALKKRGMLWSEKSGAMTHTLTAHIVEFKKGSMFGRWAPYCGDTVLVVRAELRQGNGTASVQIESKRKITYGQSPLTRAAWKKAFEGASEDIINQAMKKF